MAIVCVCNDVTVLWLHRGILSSLSLFSHSRLHVVKKTRACKIRRSENLVSNRDVLDSSLFQIITNRKLGIL